MAGGPELFVVCKYCKAEVSPYITECPYCGKRLRKRAPKLQKKRVARVATMRSTLSRLRPGEIPGIRVESNRPYATIGLVSVSVLLSFAVRIGLVDLDQVAIVGPIEGEYWKAATTLFVYTQIGYELMAVVTIGVFGWLLERRHGVWAPFVVFLLGGVAGSMVVIAVDPGAVALGANGAAFALLAAWAVRDLFGRRRAVEDDADMLAVLAFAVVLILLPLASPEANALAGMTGALTGLVLGTALSRLPER